MTETALVRIYDTPKGPHVYFGDVRIHHWTVGLATAFIGALCLIFDKDKRRRPFYALLCFGGFVAFLDDLPDFVSFLEGAES